MLEFIYLSQYEKKEKKLAEIYSFLSDLVTEYPLHQTWFAGISQELLKPQLINTREILLVTDKSKIVGASILKKTGAEQKICTLRVAKEYQGQGIGTMLINRSIDFLENEKPIISVSELKKYEFKRIFEHFGFSLGEVCFEKYAPFTNEYVFNGILSQESILKNLNMPKRFNFTNPLSIDLNLIPIL